MAGGFSNFGDADLFDGRVHGRSDARGDEAGRPHPDAGVRAPRAGRDSEWPRCSWRIRPPKFSRGRFRHLHGGRPARAALDRAPGVSQPVRISTPGSPLPAESFSGDSAGLDLVVWRDEGRRLCRYPAPDDYRRRAGGKRHPARDRAGEAKDPDRFRGDRNPAGHSLGLPDETREAWPAIVLRTRRALGARRAHL